MLKFPEIIMCLKCQILRKITREGKMWKVLETPKELFASGQVHHCITSIQIIDNIFFELYNLVEYYYVSPFVQKEAIEIVVKGLTSQVQSQESLLKKLTIFIAEIW